MTAEQKVRGSSDVLLAQGKPFPPICHFVPTANRFQLKAADGRTLRNIQES